MKNALLLLSLVTALNVGTASAAEFTMPYGLPKVADARLAISDAYDTPGGDGVESIARFATKASRQTVIDFYKAAFVEAGFVVYSSSDKPKYAMIAGKRNDDRVTVYFKHKSDWVEADESEISIKAVYKK